MQPGYKEKLIMHSLWPGRLYSSNTTVLKYLLFYACLFELAERGIISVRGKQVFCLDEQTGDPVLDEVISIMFPLSGKKLSRLQWVMPGKAPGIYKKQMQLMTEHNFLEREEIRILLWRAGYRYRVRNYDVLKPGITLLERFLVYGRKPGRDSLLMALLVGEGNLFKNVFSTKEYRQKARERYKKVPDSDILNKDYTLSQLRKTLRKSMNTQKAVNSAAVTS